MAQVLASPSAAAQLVPSWQCYAESLQELEQAAPHLEREVQLKLLAAATATVRTLRNALRLGQNATQRGRDAPHQPAKVSAQNTSTAATLSDDQKFQVNKTSMDKKESQLNVHAPKDSTQIRVRGLSRYDIYNAVLQSCEQLVEEAGLAEEKQAAPSGKKSCVKCLSLRDSTTIVDFRYEPVRYAGSTCY